MVAEKGFFLFLFSHFSLKNQFGARPLALIQCKEKKFKLMKNKKRGLEKTGPNIHVFSLAVKEKI